MWAFGPGTYRVVMAVATIGEPVRAPASTRIHGLDVARGLAMLGMVIVHYVWPGEEPGLGATVARAMDGRAMPLFMMLGGIGVVLVSQRSANPDRGLVIRAVLLFALGLYLDERDGWVAIVLQFYGLLFLLGPLVRRLSVPVVAAAGAASVAIGAVTYQVVGRPPQPTSWESVLDGWPGIRSLFFDGYYPFFPVFAFFALGLVIARLDLRDDRVATVLASVGAVVGLVAWWVSGRLADGFGVDPEAGADSEMFRAARLLDVSGHSAMPAWVISAAGSSVAVIGLSLLAARRWPAAVRPVATLGTVALSFYVFQVLMTEVVPRPSTTPISEEWLTVVGLYGSFTAAAMIWKRRFRSGPLEAVLRIGSTRRS